MSRKETEFDIIAEEIDNIIKKSLGVFDKLETTIVRYKGEYLKYILPNTEKKDFSILDFGCGTGRCIPYFKEFLPQAQIYGCDVSDKSIRKASRDFQDCHFMTIESPCDLQVYNGRIDCVFISTVLHHIPHQEHSAWIRALYNVLKTNGYIVIFEMNMHNPLAKRFVCNCPYDANAVMLKPSYCKTLVADIFGQADLAYTFFFPWRTKFFVTIEHKISWMPFGAQYYVVAKKNKE